MKNYKLNFLFASLLVLLFSSNLSAQWTISGETTAVCPGQTYKYEAAPPTQANCGVSSCNTKYFGIENGKINLQRVEGSKLVAYVSQSC
jgi:hypothetical protein